jgi:hypothetical protein
LLALIAPNHSAIKTRGLASLSLPQRQERRKMVHRFAHGVIALDDGK